MILAKLELEADQNKLLLHIDVDIRGVSIYVHNVLHVKSGSALCQTAFYMPPYTNLFHQRLDETGHCTIGLTGIEYCWSFTSKKYLLLLGSTLRSL